MLTRVVTGQDFIEGWVVQDGVCRYCIAYVGAVIVRTVLFEYFATEVIWRE